MPVHFDDYESSDAAVEVGSNAGQILQFLARSPEKGYRPAEIYEALDLARGSVGPTLNRLKERGLVRHKEPYWAIAVEQEEVANLLHISDAYEMMDARYGEEDFESAVENAVDPREMRDEKDE
jgi:DNA-binding transcriptional ArsR family regulator